MKNHLTKTGIVIIVSLLIGSCFQADDQSKISKKDWSIANPKPIERDFEGINKKHKVLMAIFDSGVDYNHPELIKNMHFFNDTMSNDQETLTAGYDFLGLDSYPHPRLLRTSATSNSSDIEASRKSTSMTRHCINSLILDIEPKLSKWIHPMIDEEMEKNASTFHGTHVAGLMTYDRDDFGLLAYRVLPFTTAEAIQASEVLNKRFEAAIEHAHKNGVKIINISLGGDLQKPTDSDDKEEYEKGMEKIKNELEYIAQRKEIFQKYPDILFVIAAGNSSRWSDQNANISTICGIEAPNILCVGSLNSKGDISSFSNIPLNKVDLVFALGENVKSLIPTNYCNDLNAMLISVYNSEWFKRECNPFIRNTSNDKKSKKQFKAEPPEVTWFVKFLAKRNKGLKQTLASAIKRCEANKDYTKLNGTSMAAPLVAHLAGEIVAENNTELTPQEIIQKIYEKAEIYDIGHLKVYKLKIKRPSWDINKEDDFLKKTIASLDDGIAYDVLHKLEQEQYLTLEFVKNR